MEKTADRITLTFGQKIGLPNYSSRDVHITYSTDSIEGETPAQTYDRACKFVVEKIKEELIKITPKSKQ